MNTRILASIAVVLTSSGLAYGQTADVPGGSTGALPETAPVVVSPASGPTGGHLWDGWNLGPKCADCFANGAGSGYLTTELEYLLYFFETNGTNTTLGASNVLGAVGTAILDQAGNERFDHDPLSGARLTVGYWWPECATGLPCDWVQSGGVEARLFSLGHRSFNFMRDTSPILVRPFFNLNSHTEDAVIVALPGVAAGTLAGVAKLDAWGGEANVWKNVFYDYPGTTCSIDAMAGFRYMDMDRDIEISRASVFSATPVNPPAAVAPLAGSRINEAESFQTRNQFYGGQVGARARLYLEKVIVEGGLKLALGDTHQELTIAGNQVRTAPNGTTQVFNGALLALNSNIGKFTRDKFSQIPEGEVNAIIPILNHVQFKVGYSFLFWSKVLRPADQIDRVADVTQIPSFPPGVTAVPTGLQRPTVPFKESDQWIHGLNIGVEFIW